MYNFSGSSQPQATRDPAKCLGNIAELLCVRFLQILNEFEGCVREVNIIQGETDGAEPSPAAPMASATVYPAEAPYTAAPAAGLPAASIRAEPSAEGTAAERTAAERFAAAEGTAAERFAALGGADFEATFGVPRGAFEKLPAWKQTLAKKTHGLF